MVALVVGDEAEVAKKKIFRTDFAWRLLTHEKGGIVRRFQRYLWQRLSDCLSSLPSQISDSCDILQKKASLSFSLGTIAHPYSLKEKVEMFCTD